MSPAMETSRRELLALLPTAIATLGCIRTGKAHGRAGLQPDFEFAELTLQWANKKQPAVRTRLSAHPALAALIRHQKLSGNSNASAADLLEQVLNRPVNAETAARVLGWTRAHESELVRSSMLAADYLPSSARLGGRIYLVTGYDIGVAAPPDIAINVAHAHFGAAPSEINHYVTHEAHHVGFLQLRNAPSLEGLDDPKQLLKVVRFFTQLEGMGVHAAYAPRRTQAALEGDADYRIYLDDAHARSVCTRYDEVLSPAMKGGPLRDEEIGAILNAMSSGERLWYRVGALVSAMIERQQGRQSLIDSINSPDIFLTATGALLARMN
jgi:hypothetical protein